MFRVGRNQVVDLHKQKQGCVRFWVKMQVLGRRKIVTLKTCWRRLQDQQMFAGIRLTPNNIFDCCSPLRIKLLKRLQRRLSLFIVAQVRSNTTFRILSIHLLISKKKLKLLAIHCLSSSNYFEERSTLLNKSDISILAIYITPVFKSLSSLYTGTKISLLRLVSLF